MNVLLLEKLPASTAGSSEILLKISSSHSNAWKISQGTNKKAKIADVARADHKKFSYQIKGFTAVFDVVFLVPCRCNPQTDLIEQN